jgi:hypothetical protein
MTKRSRRVLVKRIPGLGAFIRVLRRQPPRSRRHQLLKRIPKNSIGAEIGVHEGDFSQTILQEVGPARLHLIDPWEYYFGEQYADAWYGGGTSAGQVTMDQRYEAIERRFSGEIDSGRVVLHRGYSSEVAGLFDDEYFDWVYVDGNHTEEYVRLDLEHYLPKLKSGGLLAGDDYGTTG